jgi:hypothetical protein
MAADGTPAAWVGYVFRHTWRQTAFSWRYTKADLNAYLHRLALAAHKLNPAA